MKSGYNVGATILALELLAFVDGHPIATVVAFPLLLGMSSLIVRTGATATMIALPLLVAGGIATPAARRGGTQLVAVGWWRIASPTSTEAMTFFHLYYILKL